ncbi:hypothetical protein CGC20_14165 [Leishmania donovani]|uniref:Uncharacterized protein n=1 Tax=Leishmania donovani TaxID=5661 RepID=A0A504XKH0_LEIDO|nr:hypothetical protein CGC20_14165 [Leishmania donovani]
MLAVPGRGARKCFVTDAAPAVPFGLELCYMHSHNACCLPGNDKDIQTAYSALVPKGQGCVAGSQRIYTSLYALRQYLCLPCDPKEPLYRFESVKGDMVDGGLVPPSTNSVAGEQTWRICRSFLYGKEGTRKGLWGHDGSRYAECGVIVSSCMSTPVFNITAASFQSPSPSCVASNELIIPSITFRGSPNPALEMLSMVTQSIPDFQIVIRRCQGGCLQWHLCCYSGFEVEPPVYKKACIRFFVNPTLLVIRLTVEKVALVVVHIVILGGIFAHLWSHAPKKHVQAPLSAEERVAIRQKMRKSH